MDKVRAHQVSALALRVRKNLPLVNPICPYILADSMGLTIRFVKIPSFEGMYLKEYKQILISSDRPEGRKRFSAAHELGHHILGHGTKIDEIIENGADSIEEKEADFFSSMLLMPKSSISNTFIRFDKKISNFTPVDILIIANYFGVSYVAFLTHLRFNLGLIPHSLYSSFKSIDIINLRHDLLGIKTAHNTFFVGNWWIGRAVEMEVGDYLIGKENLLIDGPAILEIDRETSTLRAVSSGITRVYTETGWSSFVKISKKNYKGLFEFKYEDYSDE